MDGVRRKVLSLGNRKKSSPRDLLRDAPSPELEYNPSNASSQKPTCQSPSIICISGCDLECTPPRTKFGLDDSFGHCPHTVDDSSSPSIMLSQTLSTESPEVSWKWKHSTSSNFDKTTATDISAYGADNNCTSVGFNNADACRFARSGIGASAWRQKLEKRRRDEKYILEQNKRKAEKLKMDEVLKRRFAKIQEHLKYKEHSWPLENTKNYKKSPESCERFVSSTCKSSCKEQIIPSKEQNALANPTTSIEATKIRESIDHFFNDSVSDCLLLEATQKLESQIIRLTQSPPDNYRQKRKALNELEPTAVSTTPKSSHKKKPRSSLYLKFLEDDSADDWFISLDHSAFEVTQSKSRSNLQRYKSMPAENTSSNFEACNQLDCKIGSASPTQNIKGKNSVNNASRNSTGNLKRHASSNIENPLNTSCKVQEKHTG